MTARPTASLSSAFSAARRQFPHTRKQVYLNSAAYGPLSLPVQRAIEDNIRLRIAAEKDDTRMVYRARDELRAAYARMIGAAKRQVAIGLSTSFGLNIAAFGLPLSKGDEVLVSDIEFPALVYTFRAAAERRSLKLTFVKSRNRHFDIDELQRTITRRSRVLAISWVQFFNGYKNDLKALAAICRENNMFLVVDGIQGMGVEPINVRRLGIDIFSAGCQKWMLSPQGCGFFYLSDAVRDLLKPPFMSWLGIDWKLQFEDLFRYDLPYIDSAERFDLGYYNVHSILGMRAASDFFQRLGIGNIQKRNYMLLDRLTDFLKASSHYSITSEMAPKHRSSILTFTCSHLKQLHRELKRQRIVVAVREGSIRVAVHLFNNRQDIDRLILVLDRYSESV
ncbi:MAG: aminotransferase class V-fold PLP-dependent enzyme [Candidatus Zixiibacteriota bacterium]